MTGPREDVSLEEATSAMAEPKPTDGSVKLEGANVPEHLRGKTLDDVVKMATAATEALRISEDARKAAEVRGQTSPPPVIIQAPSAPAAVVEPTEEQIAEAFEKNPIATIRWMQDKAVKDAERNLEARLGPLGASAVMNGESYAKGKYSAEFSVLGSEIESVKAEILKQANGQSILSTPAGWDQMMSYIRGKPGNFEKLVESNRKTEAEKAALAARETQSRSTGFSPAPTAGGEASPGEVRPISGAAGLDETQRKIADTFIAQGVFKDYAEYAKWAKMGG